MDSIRVDICYRPFRIAWAIRAGDKEAFRKAVRLSSALWGGRFNPIVIVDQPKQAEDMITLFRVDMILPIGDSEPVRSFPSRFPHVINPFWHDNVFVGTGEYGNPSQVLDIQNLLTYIYRKPEWEDIKKHKMRLYRWQPDDPLRDVFLIHLGEYPSDDESPTNYRELVSDTAEEKELDILSTSALPADTFEHPTISYLSRYGLRPHYSIRDGWTHVGFYSGDASNLDDLVACWNLRAANITVFFVDPNHLERYGDTITSRVQAMQQLVSGRRFDFERHLAVWARVDASTNTSEGLDAIIKPFAGKAATVCRIFDDFSWSGGAVQPPMMHLGEVSTLGIVSTEGGKRTISFGLEGKPFSGDVWFHNQSLVASLSFTGGAYADEQYTLVPPFVPELNEFYSRSMTIDYSKIKSEPDRIGLVIDANDAEASISAVPVLDLVERIFDLAGFSATLSPGGWIARQLIAQLGGVHNARAFKIPGVRRLLKTYGPNDPFTKKTALQLIGCTDPDNPDVSFKDFQDLYIEPRPRGERLTPSAVFAFLVEKGLFRLGAELKCPNCRLASWTALDPLKRRVICELCGHVFDSTRQLINEDCWKYRRSGVLGKERNAQGAVPVVLTLQQFEFNFNAVMQRQTYSPSLDLKPKNGVNLPECEIDFMWLIQGTHPDRPIVMIGECKDRGGERKRGKDSGTIDAGDIENLRRVADALPSKRFETFIVLAKLCPFTLEELTLSRTLNTEHIRRVILLTARELEPLHFFDRTKLEYKGISARVHSANDLAMATHAMYFVDAAHN